MSQPQKPLLVLATYDDETARNACWWIRRNHDGWYETVDRDAYWKIASPQNLIPAATDYHVDRGDNAAIVEIWNAREAKSKGA